MKRRKFIGQKVVLDFNGVIRRAKIQDVEFSEGLGPIFLLESGLGNKFWLTRRELKDHEVHTNRN
jgi:hypothetical protein